MLFVAKDEKKEGRQERAVLGAAALSHLNAIWALCVCFLFEISIFSIHGSISFHSGCTHMCSNSVVKFSRRRKSRPASMPAPHSLWRLNQVWLMLNKGSEDKWNSQRAVMLTSLSSSSPIIVFLCLSRSATIWLKYRCTPVAAPCPMYFKRWKGGEWISASGFLQFPFG